MQKPVDIGMQKPVDRSLKKLDTPDSRSKLYHDLGYNFSEKKVKGEDLQRNFRSWKLYL